MFSRHVLVVVLCLMAMLTAGCNSATPEGGTRATAETEARNFFSKEMPNRHPDPASHWGMWNVRVFGSLRPATAWLDWAGLADWADGLGAGRAKAQPDSPGWPTAIEVIQPFWISGMPSEGGDRMSFCQTMTITLASDKQSITKWRVTGYQLGQRSRLPVTRQLRAWFLWTLLAPILLFLMVAVLVYAFLAWLSDDWKWFLVRFGCFLLILPYQAYIGWAAFGSGLAVVANVFLVLVAARLSLGLLRRLALKP